MLRIYQRGTVSIVNGSATVLGHDTRWLDCYVQSGDRFQVSRDKDIYTVKEVPDRRTLILTEAYRGSSAEGIAYQVDKINIAEEARLSRAKAAKIKAIKREASRLITQVAPPWKQRNLLARGLELQHKNPATWSESEQQESEAITSIWAQIKAIRTKSDELEAQVTAAAAIDDVQRIATK